MHVHAYTYAWGCGLALLLCSPEPTCRNNHLPNVCRVLVAQRSLEVSSSPVRAPPLPACHVDALGSAPGRWVRSAAVPAATAFVGLREWPWLWVPYECAPPLWPGPAAVNACTAAVDLLFVGLSRERTNFFDVHDLAGEQGIPYAKLQNSARLGSTAFGSFYHWQPHDWAAWNAANVSGLIVSGDGRSAQPLLANTARKLRDDMRDARWCADDRPPPSATAEAQPLQQRPTAFMLATIEEFWLAEHALRARWPAVVGRFMELLRELCPRAHVVYKTSTAAQPFMRFRTSERHYASTRAAAAAARAAGLPVLDSFTLTQPFAVDESVFADRLHPFDLDHSLRGNFLSHAVTMLLLHPVCARAVPQRWTAAVPASLHG